MSISLVKGQKIDIKKDNPSLNNLELRLGWDTNKYDGGEDFDLDSCIGLVGENGNCSKDSNFVYFQNLESNGARHFGDNLTGKGDGDDEIIAITLDKIDADVNALNLHVVIYAGAQRNQNFGQVSNAYVKVVDVDTNKEICKYDLAEDYSIETMVNVAKLYRHDGSWKIQAIGEGSQGGFPEILKTIGLK